MSKIIKPCQRCGKDMLLYPSTAKIKKFCSMKCNYPEQPTIVCLECKKPFKIEQHRLGIARFCSRECNGRYNYRIQPFKNPNLKGNKFRQGKKPTNAFTSEQVRGEASPSWIKNQERVCPHCKKIFRKPPNVIKRSKTINFCSRECFIKSGIFRGKKSPCWEGGPVSYRGKNWKEIRLGAVARDNGTCKICNKIVGNSIAVHHIRPFREFNTAEEANHINNLICLCQSCHRKYENLGDKISEIINP